VVDLLRCGDLAVEDYGVGAGGGEAFEAAEMELSAVLLRGCARMDG